jgi:hypothetical protein
MGTGEDGEDGEVIFLMPNAQCPMPNYQSPIPKLCFLCNNLIDKR